MMGREASIWGITIMQGFSLTRRRLTGAGVGLVLACIAAPAMAQTKIKFTLDWVFQGPTSPFLVADQKGYYKAEGLEVTLDSGQGSAGALQRVATGAYDMGFADINSLVEFNVKNPTQAVKAVMMAYDFPPFGVYALKKSGIAKPTDINGKKLGAPAFDASYRLFPAFAKATGINLASVQMVNMEPRLREQSLIQGSVDVIAGHYFSSFLDLKARGVAGDDIVVMRYADAGMDFYGNAVIASPAMLQKPEAVKGFVKATIKAWAEVAKSPQVGVDAAKKRDGLIDEKVEMERLMISLDTNVITPYVKANGMGGVDTARLDRSLVALTEAFALPTTPKAADIFTAEFLPPQAERMISK